MRHLLTTATVAALLVTFGGTVGAQGASSDPEASPTPEQLAAAEERLATATCLGKPATIVAIAGFETVGTPDADVIVSTDGDDIIRGEGGNDRICAGGGADTVYGGAGRDLIDGGPGDDRLRGGAGKDTLDGGEGDDICTGGPGSDWLRDCNDSKATSGELVILSDTKLEGPHQGPIVIGADKVTLDCRGHTVSGRGDGNGILLEGRRRAGVVNCEVTDFASGIRVTRSERIAIDRNYIHDNTERGLELDRSVRNLIARNRVVDNGFGRPSTSGLDVQASRRNDFYLNTVSGDSEVGFNLAPDADRNRLINNTVKGTGYGFRVDGARNAFRRNHVTGPRHNGFRVSPTAASNVFVKNTVTGTLAGDGFDIQGTGGVYTLNRSFDNAGLGLKDTAGPGANTYAGNACVGNQVGGSSPEGLCDDSPPLESQPSPEPSDSTDSKGAPTAEE